ncbi:hypothetical protein IEO70_03835 [Bacillus sp. AGMB 02131]|uniref:Uncharacterized protein n=1 Tax=Peribacillus faecalis TaxID=2772559 RepID=A0A927CUU6_9BACI|nr:hypothetical protein [Peribacillus faecalis]MBD3107486.1 hypothetical protein [Peribacillus faecalis]
MLVTDDSEVLEVMEAVKRTISVAFGTSTDTVDSVCGASVWISFSGSVPLVAPIAKSVSNPVSPVVTVAIMKSVMKAILTRNLIVFR